MSLNGTWKFFWVKDADARPTDFWKTSFNDKGWDNMQVPAVWELNGFGEPSLCKCRISLEKSVQEQPALRAH